MSGSLGSLTALSRAADEARRRGAAPWPAPTWQPPGGGELASRRGPGGASLLIEERQETARERASPRCPGPPTRRGDAVPNRGRRRPGNRRAVN
ncbi:hypothetical protein [Streptomyces sp. AS02]|uniref:hypothetical protein n=1 Tax=Streptomyces sp. AS02 TaxID=2938946 RepID=UPI0027B98852|nr:hypothetical protein [Streptomyces sp. AS02]